jgi:hypothetical protein
MVETVCKKPSLPLEFEAFGVSNRDLERFFGSKLSVFGGPKMVEVPSYCTYTKYWEKNNMKKNLQQPLPTQTSLKE